MEETGLCISEDINTLYIQNTQKRVGRFPCY